MNLYEFLKKIFNRMFPDRKGEYAGRTHVMTFGDDGILNPYKQWKWWSKKSDNPKQDENLGVINVQQGRNDVQIKAVFEKYDLYDKLNS